MEKVIAEYRVESKLHGALLLQQLRGMGAGLALVLPYLDSRSRGPEVSYYCLWADNMVTRGTEKMDIEDVLDPDYRFIEWNPSIKI